MRCAFWCQIYLLGLGVVLLSAPAMAPEPAQPVLVELFTSEGCSSCPPADALLRTLDEQQPVPGARIVVLSEHVDYWDRLGWRDPFSSSTFTQRQAGYVRHLHTDGPYTPQAVIDGEMQLVGSNANAMLQAIRRASDTPKRQIDISPVFRTEAGSAVVRIRVAGSDRRESKRRYNLLIAVADDHATSAVLRGENGGRRLQHVAIVRKLVDLGRLDEAEVAERLLPLEGNLHFWAGKRLVAFTQEQDFGPVLGVGMRVLPVHAK